MGVWDIAAKHASAQVKLSLVLAGKPAIDPAARRVACPCRTADPDRGTIVFWDLDRNAKHSELPTDFFLVGCSTALSPDGSLLAVGTRTDEIRLIDLPAGRTRVELPEAHGSAVAILRWDGDRRFLSWGVEGNLRQWELAENPLRESPLRPRCFVSR